MRASGGKSVDTPIPETAAACNRDMSTCDDTHWLGADFSETVSWAADVSGEHPLGF